MTAGPTQRSAAYPDDPIASIRDALVDRYEIGDEIGSGGMALVYRARDIRHDRQVAIKVLRPELAAAVGAERFLREINLEARLNHPHILTLIDSGEVDYSLYAVTPWAEGGTLRDRIRRESQLPVDEALRVITQVGDALAYAHRSGIVHRDVKPENILFASGHVQLADFGIAHVIAETSRQSLTDSGLAIGTPAYMSPEQASPGATVDQRSDEYALACVFFEMLAGEPPFTGITSQAIIARHMAERPPSLTVVRPDLPAATAEVINRALSKSPAARFPTVEAFVTALTASTTSTPVAAPSRTRARWVAALVIAAAAVVAAVLWPTRTIDLSPSRVAVFPLSTRGLPAADSGVGLGVAFLLGAALERADPLQFVDVAGRLTPAQLGDPLSIGDRVGTRIARDLRAGFAIRGVVQGHQDSTTVILRLYSVSGDSLLRTASAAGLTHLTPVHHLGIDALIKLLPALVDPDRAVSLAPLRERRAQAIALWMQGERAYRLSQFDAARAFYERALEDDSLLAQAAIKGAQAANWTHQPARAVQLAEHALSLEAQLPPKYSALARGLLSYFRGNGDSAVAHFRGALTIDPDWSEPSAALAEVFIHLFPSGGTADSARAALQRAVARDSGFTTPLFHLAEDAIREQRLRDADVLLDRLRKAGAQPALVRQLELMRSCVENPSRSPWRVRVPADTLGVYAAAKSLSAGLKQPECAEGAARTVMRSTYSPDADRQAAFLILSALLIARREDTEAVALIDSVAVRKGVVRSTFVVSGVAGAGPALLERADSLDAYARRLYGEQYERVTDPERLWVMLTWQAFRGNEARVAIVAESLSTRAAKAGTHPATTFAAAAMAQLALLKGDTAGALERLSRLETPGAPGALAWSFGASLPVERLLLARLHFRAGRYQESIRAAAIFDHSEPVIFLAYVPESLRIRLAASMALGDGPAAAVYRRRLERIGRGDLIEAARSTPR